MSRSSERVTRWRKNTKRKLFESFGSKCCCCGYANIVAMEFHHLDPSTKETYWGKINGRIRSWDYLSLEMAKCVMVCSNCHKEIHYDNKLVPEDAQRFDQQLIKTVYVPEPPVVHKKRIDRYAGVDLKALYKETKNYEALGTKFGVTGAAIKRKLNSLQ